MTGGKTIPERERLLVLPTYIFIHIPKTGGTTLRRMLHATPNIKMHNLGNQKKFLGDLADPAYLPGVISRNDIVHGHINFVPPLESFRNEISIFSLMRDPIRHAKSSYVFIRQTETHFLHPQIQGMSLREAIDNVPEFRRTINNQQTRALFGPRGMAGMPKCTENIRYILGKTEYFLDLVAYFESETGFSLTRIEKQKVSNYHNVDIDGCDDLILSLNREDQAMYDSFDKIFDSKK